MGDIVEQEQGIEEDKVSEEINSIMRNKLQAEKWNPKKVDGWTKDLIEQALKHLLEHKKGFKYIVTCVIMQRTGAGLTGSHALCWTKQDGACAVDFENDHLQCVMSMYWARTD